MKMLFPITTVAQGLDHLAAHWHPALAAIYTLLRPHAPFPKQQAQGVGTGFFMACGNGVALITADHVIKPYLEEGTGGLAMLVKGCALPLSRPFIRLPDADLCACKFELHELEAFGLSSIRTVPLITDRTGQRRLGQYVAMGFPGTWNLMGQGHRGGPSSLAIFANGRLLAKRAGVISYPREIAVDFDPKKSITGIPHPRRRGVPALNGMSGGPLFDIFCTMHYGVDESIQFGVELAGVIVRRDPRSQQVIATAREHLFELLPRVAATL